MARLVILKYGHCGIVPAEAADRAASYGSRAAQQNPAMIGGHAPTLGRRRDGRVVGQPRPCKITMENMAARHPEFGFDIERCHYLDTWLTASIESKAGLQRFGED